ncbi:MAG TPA: methyltransferase domain-containing protein [Myxococcota bacterium]|nr:methyltransferase domain-containing protein [Myxococcota bacterium]
MCPDASSLERLVPDLISPTDATGRETLLLHVERYEFAARHARPGRLLDLACGVGYGTHLLADQARGVLEAVGVDVSADTVCYASQRYGRPGLEFRVSDALTFEDASGFDTVVSLETIEHVERPADLIDRLVKALRPKGILVASVPTTPSADVNPHHLHDFTESAFRRMFAAYPLTEIDCLRQVQPYPLIRTIRRTEARMRDFRPHLLSYYVGHPAAAMRRLVATLRYGLTNRYLTVAWKRD